MTLVAASCAADLPDTAAPTTRSPAVTPASTAPPTGPTESLAVEVDFVPNLPLLRRLEVSVANTGPDDAAITALVFDSPLFDAVPTADLGTVVSAGRRRDLELALGDAVCPGHPGSSFVTVVLDVGGQTWQGSAEVDAERLEQLNERECGQRAVLERVDIAFAPDPVVTDHVLSTRLDVRSRGGDDPVTVTDVTGTLLFSVQPREPGGALATLQPGDVATSVELTIEVNRCDAHTVSQSQTSYRFPVWITVGDRETRYVLIEPHDTLRTALEGLVQACIAREAAG